LDRGAQIAGLQSSQGEQRESYQGTHSVLDVWWPSNQSVYIQAMLSLSEAYNKSVQEESTLSAEQLKTRHVGKQDPKRHLEEAVEKAMGDQVVQNLGAMLLAEL
jgi:hypothetical protein